MARIRSIKPEFFLHEGLAEISPLHRLLFVGLWTLADKHGRLEDRPRRIKASLLPWEECDVDALLEDLCDAGFIVRYERDSKDCISIPSFLKHQRPHPKESAYDLPAPEPGKETASREKKRLAKPNQPGIPSSPAGKEILESGKEILEVGAMTPFFDLPSPTKPNSLVRQISTQRATERPSASLMGDDLREALEATFLRVKGHKYAWQPGDDLATRRLPTLDVAECCRRFENGLPRARYPLCSGVEDLAKHWNAYATEQPKPADKSAGDRPRL